MKNLHVLIYVLTLTVVAPVNSNAADIVVGLPAVDENGNCLPFSCAHAYSLVTYQQAYASTAFSGPTTITGLEFYNTEYQSPGTLNSGVYSLGFGYTSQPVNALDLTDPANNINSPIQTFFTGSLPSLLNGVLRFNGNPFLYDPSLGNLLLVVTPFNAANSDILWVFLDQAAGTNATNRALFTTNSTFGNDGGLITGFVTTAIPEPGSSLLMTSGIAAAWLSSRSKRRL